VNIRRIVSALFTVLLASGLVVGFGQAAHADNNPQPGSWYELYLPYFNPGAFKCLDVPNGSSANGLVLQVFHCHGYASNGAPQRWNLVSWGAIPDAPRFEIVNVGTGECLNVTSGATGTRVIQQAGCVTTESEVWVLHTTPNVGPYFALSNLAFPNECMAASNSSGGDHTPVEIADCNYFNQNDPTWIRQVWSLG
jgi:hypothetical protein